MLNLNCVICAEIFTSTDNVYSTSCGHMFHYSCLLQWLERSKTCPQCRHRCTDKTIVRLYFNLANLDTSRVDVGSLQSQLDNTKLQIKSKELEIKHLEEQVKSLKHGIEMATKTVSGLKRKVEEANFLNQTLTEQMKVLKADVKVIHDLRKQVQQLKQELAVVESTTAILNASSGEVDKMLKTEKDPKTLATMVTVLKRELKGHEFKKTDLRNVLKITQSDLRKELENKKLSEERISELESQNYQLSEKLKTLQLELKSNTDNHPPRDTKTLVHSVVDKNKRLNISPSVRDNVKTIEISDSPYFNIKSSSIGMVPLFKRKPDALANENIVKTSTAKLATIKVSSPVKKSGHTYGTASSSSATNLRKHNSDLTEHYAIMKKPRLGTAVAAATANAARLTKPLGGSRSHNMVSNGLGGSARPESFIEVSSDEEETKQNGVHISSSALAGIRKYTGTIPKTSTPAMRGLRNLKFLK